MSKEYVHKIPQQVAHALQEIRTLRHDRKITPQDPDEIIGDHPDNISAIPGHTIVEQSNPSHVSRFNEAMNEINNHKKVLIPLGLIAGAATYLIVNEDARKEIEKRFKKWKKAFNKPVEE